MNQIMQIQPVFKNGYWSFSDDATGLISEPFVGETNKIITEVSKGIDNAAEGFILTFSPEYFPTHTDLLLKTEQDGGGGTWYYHIKSGIDGWLCPALFLYMTPAPDKIYCRADKKE